MKKAKNNKKPPLVSGVKRVTKNLKKTKKTVKKLGKKEDAVVGNLPPSLCEASKIHKLTIEPILLELNTVQRKEVRSQMLVSQVSDLIKQINKRKGLTPDFSVDNHSPEIREKLQKLINEIARSYRDAHKNILRLMGIRQWFLYGYFDPSSQSFLVKGKLAEPIRNKNLASPDEKIGNRHLIDYLDSLVANVESRYLALFNQLFEAKVSVYKCL